MNLNVNMNIKYSLHASLFIFCPWILLLACDILSTHARLVISKIFKSERIDTVSHLSNVWNIKLREVVSVFVWFFEEYASFLLFVFIKKFLRINKVFNDSYKINYFSLQLIFNDLEWLRSLTIDHCICLKM